MTVEGVLNAPELSGRDWGSSMSGAIAGSWAMGAVSGATVLRPVSICMVDWPGVTGFALSVAGTGATTVGDGWKRNESG